MFRGLVTAACAALITAATVPASAAAPDNARGPDDRRTQYGEYVAMGDSFTAGPLIHPIRLDRPWGCVVSARNYPARLAAYFDVDTYRDVSCSGARSKHLWNSQQTSLGTNAPQLDALSPDTDLVTLGMGGNDFGLFGSMIDTCSKVAKDHPKGTPCKKHFTNKRGTDTKMRDAKRIRRHIARSVRAIEKRAPNAKIVVVGYLRLLPPVGTCGAVPFAKGDYKWGNKVQLRLNKSLRQGAQRNGATYVGMWRASIGHDACGSGVAWVNGAEVDLLRAMSFHPFAKGMKGIARETYRQLTGTTAPRIKPYDTGAPTAGKRQTMRLARLVS